MASSLVDRPSLSKERWAEIQDEEHPGLEVSYRAGSSQKGKESSKQSEPKKDRQERKCFSELGTENKSLFTAWGPPFSYSLSVMATLGRK